MRVRLGVNPFPGQRLEENLSAEGLGRRIFALRRPSPSTKSGIRSRAKYRIPAVAEGESLQVDVLIVGGGPAGLAAAIRLGQLAKKAGKEISVAVIEKAREFGMHQLSGAVMDMGPFEELLPDWKEREAPLDSEVTEDHLWYLTEHEYIPLPIPRAISNLDCRIVSLSRLVRWMAKQAEELGVMLLPGFAGERLVFEGDRVAGVRTGDKGVDKNGKPRSNFEPGVRIEARATLLAEGTLGTLTRDLIRKYRLDEGCNPQVWALGVKELWEVREGAIREGTVLTTMGYPLRKGMFGGGFLYAMKERRVSIGLVIGLDYADPQTDAHLEMQRFKLHPKIRSILEDGKLLEYGAKTIPDAGFFSIPRLAAPGALLLGDAGGLVNNMRLKGIHLAIQSGHAAAECAFESVTGKPEALAAYPLRWRETSGWRELREARYFKQGFEHGTGLGMVNAGLMSLTRGWSPLPRRLRAGHLHMRPRREFSPVDPVTFDGKLTFSKVDAMYYSNTHHDEDSRCHLVVTDPKVCVERCAEEYGNPCVKFCPANVYEWIRDEDGRGKLHIGFGNCVHCKTCDIMDPYQVIQWQVPEGGGGPGYTSL